VIDRQYAYVDKIPLDHIGGDLPEGHLAESRSPEAGARGCPQGHTLRRLVAQGELSGEPFAEVTVGLEATREIDQHLRRHIAFRIDVHSEVRPVPIRRIAWSKAGEDR
jgi:hypothetical protein